MEYKGKVISLYDFTGEMVIPWLEAGYECFIFDGQHVGHTQEEVRNGLLHRVEMWFFPNDRTVQAEGIREIVGDGVHMVFGFPPCTELTNAGSRHWAKKRAIDPNFQIDAKNLCVLVEDLGKLYDVPWAFENPVGVLSSMYRKPDFMFHPTDFALYLPTGDVHPLYPQIYPTQDRYNKKTCLWWGNGTKEPEKRGLPALHKDNPGWKKCGGKSLKTKNIRSCTPRGFAEAFYQANK